MHALLVLALLTASPPGSVPRWEPYAANPKWEVLGTEDETGVFRFTHRRAAVPRAAGEPVVNFGVHLSPMAGNGPVVMGNDAATAKMLVGQSKVTHAADCRRGDCDGNQCKRKDKPLERFEKDIAEGLWMGFRPVEIAAAAGFALLALGLIALLVVALIVTVVAKPGHPLAPNTQPADGQSFHS